MRTGTDVSLTTCREWGYPVVEHGDKDMDPDKMYRLTISVPEVWPKGRLLPGTRAIKAWDVDMFTAYNELWRMFEAAGPGIRSFCDFANCPYSSPTENPSFEDFASLAGTVRAYCGLNHY